MKPWLAAAGLVTLAIAGCGRPGGGGTPVVTPPAQALAAWDGFPADASPRPILWLGSYSPQGFTTDGGKLAAMCSRFALGTGLPRNLPGQITATWEGGITVMYRGISAAEAFAALSRPDPAMASSGCASVNPIVISGARVGTAEFATDRGTARMTAWLFTAAGVVGEFAWPALVPSAFWNGRMIEGSGNGASVSADGKALTFVFAGAPDSPGPCGADYRGAVAESAFAVAVAVQAMPHSSPNDLIACTAIAQERSVTVKLASPLGGRVVADADGKAVAVCAGYSLKGC
jgi:hypothetical protein